jgi:hypothetical protein
MPTVFSASFPLENCACYEFTFSIPSPYLTIVYAHPDYWKIFCLFVQSSLPAPKTFQFVFLFMFKFYFSRSPIYRSYKMKSFFVYFLASAIFSTAVAIAVPEPFPGCYRIENYGSQTHACSQCKGGYRFLHVIATGCDVGRQCCKGLCCELV